MLIIADAQLVAHQHFDKPLVKALMTPVGNAAQHPWNTQPRQDRVSRPFISEGEAMDKLFGSGLEKVLGELQL
jgi:hypothetical protein